MVRLPDSFDKLLMKLEPGCPDIPEAYVRCRHRLIKFFQWRNCEDSEGLADDTIARLIQKHSAGVEIQADNPYSYLYAIALNVFKEYLRYKKKVEKIQTNWRPATQVNDKYVSCKKHCFERLSSDKQDLLTRYYGSNETPESIAETLGISLGALRLRVYRIKEDELRPCYRNCRGR